MATKDTEIQVRLDVRLAKAALNGLKDHAKKAGKSVKSEIKRGIGTGLTGIGVGAGIGMAFAGIRGATQSSFGAMAGETFGHWGAMLENWLLGDLGVEARAKAQTREELANSFAYQIGKTGDITPEARSWFNTVNKIRETEAQGRKIIDMDADMRGPGIGKMLERIGEVLLKVMMDFGNWFLGKLGF